MSAEIVNLRRARKDQARARASAEAAQNRAVHGRSLAERKAADLADLKITRHLDGHKLKPSPRDDG